MGATYIKSVVALSRAYSDAEVQQKTVCDLVLIGEGDSRTTDAPAAGYFDAYTLPSTVSGLHLLKAVGGSKLVDVVSRAPTEDLFGGGGRKIIYTLLIGANDLGTYAGATDADAAANYWADLQTCLNARVAAGIIVIPITELPIAVAAHDARRNILNPNIRAWGAAHWGYIDFAADSIMGPDNSYAVNPSYWLNNIHPGVTGQQRMLAIYKAFMDPFIASLLA